LDFEGRRQTAPFGPVGTPAGLKKNGEEEALTGPKGKMLERRGEGGPTISWNVERQNRMRRNEKGEPHVLKKEEEGRMRLKPHKKPWGEAVVFQQKKNAKGY